MPIEILKLPAACGAPRALAEALLPSGEAGTLADLSSTLVVLPGDHAIDRFRKRLLERAAELDVCLLPPDCCTPGQLVKRTVPESGHSASPMAGRQAWRRAVEELGSPWGGADSPTKSAPISEGLLDHLLSLSSDCSSAMLTFADIARRGATLGEHFETGLWERLALLQQRMVELLAECGLEDPSMRAIDVLRDGSPALVWSSTRRIVAITAAPTQAQLAILRAAATQGLQVQVAIHAGAHSVLNAVDSEGFPNAATWGECPIDIDAGRIQVVDGPAEMTSAVGRLVLATDTCICLPDAKLLGGLVNELGGGRPVRVLGQRQFTHCRIGTLLQSIQSLATEWSWEALAAFVRHPDVSKWLRCSGLVQAVTRYRLESLAISLNEDVPPNAIEEHERIRPALKLITDLLHPLRNEALGVTKWANALAKAIQAIVGNDAGGNSPAERAESVRLLLGALGHLRDLPPSLAPSGAAERFELLACALKGQTIPPAAAIGAIDCLGWLECGMHDGGRLIFAGMNEGALPARLTNDPWLPDSVRQRLRMPTAASQYARDSWILHSLLTARDAEVHFVVARRNAKSDPLQPSRLLLRPEPRHSEPPGESLATRVLHLVAKPTKQAGGATRAGGSGIPIARQPLPKGTGDFDHISVTHFKDWLISPRLFQFKHDPRLRLTVRSDVEIGLDASQFGTLAHEVLKRFGESQIAGGHATTDSEVWAALQSALDDALNDKFTTAQREALGPELESLEARLRRFAKRQAEHARSGWQIKHVEIELTTLTPVVMPGQRQLPLRGRIDRIDFHPDRGWLALDYKTGGKAKEAAISRRKKDDPWTDLQLPLYRDLLLNQSGEYPGEIGVGLVNLPEEAENDGFRLADWNKDVFDSAEQKAAQIAQLVIRGIFTEHEIPTNDLHDLAILWGKALRGGEDES